MAWLVENIGTIAVLTVLVAAIVAVIVNMVKKKKSGACSCGCSSCPMSEKCPSKQNAGK